MVALTGGRLEIDPVSPVLRHLRVVELEDDPERARGRERAVGVEAVAEISRLQALRQPGRAVGADGDYRKTQLRELGRCFAQLTELRVAVGSPAAPVEDEKRPAVVQHLREIDGIAAHGV